MTTMYVTYPGDAATRFDRDYYVAQHLPLVMECWAPYGLQSCGAFFPSGDGAGTIAIAIAECKFRGAGGGARLAGHAARHGRHRQLHRRSGRAELGGTGRGKNLAAHTLLATSSLAPSS